MNKFNITLNPGTAIENCILYNKRGEPEECPDQYQLTKVNTGQLQYNKQNDQYVYTSPQGCNPQSGKSCEVQFVLPKYEILKLSDTNEKLARFIESQKNNLGEPSELPSGGGQPSIPVNPEIPGVPSVPSNESNFPWLPFAGIFTIIFVSALLLRGPVQKLIFGSPQPDSRQRGRKQTQSASTSTYHNSISTGADQISLITEEVRRQLTPIRDKISNLELSVLSIEQKLQDNSLSSISGIKIGAVRDQQSHGQITPEVSFPAPPPPPISVDIIKQAVASCSYQLISSYPHEFLSETADSRQGLTDKKQFAVEGSRSQASTRSQSEFIAIPCSGEIYLIPNILPNAADPARTIKRHADRNTIYQPGSSSNILALKDLAAIAKRGELYELVTDGSIA